MLERWFLFVILSGQVWKHKWERNCIYWYEILQHGMQHLLEDYKYNSNSSAHHALAGSLQFLEHTIAVSILIFVVGSLTSYSWDSTLSSDICQYYFCRVLIKFSHLLESLTVLLGQLWSFPLATKRELMEAPNLVSITPWGCSQVGVGLFSQGTSNRTRGTGLKLV